MSPKLADAITRGKELGLLALYFGCWDQPGHYLHMPRGSWVGSTERRALLLPWTDSLMDGGLLKNGKRSDITDGRVFWTCGGVAFWYAFYWWDRSGDKRGASNSGFYVRGYGWPEPQLAFDYACSQFPHIVRRQRFPLVLQELRP